jgi:signal transduction histidine kinase
LLIRWVLDPTLGDRYPYAASFLIIALTIWHFGWRAAACAVLVYFPVANYCFVVPRGAFNLEARQDALGFAIDVASAGILIYLGHAARSATSELLQANAELAEAARHKDEFLATLSHELRNPLAPIVMATDLLEHAKLQDAQAVEAVRVLARQTRQMRGLLDDLLDHTRIARGKFELKRSFVDVRSCVEDALQSHQALIEKKQQTVSVNLPESPVTASVDARRITQIMANLIGNAVKYSQEKAEIAVKLVKAHGKFSISVLDNGPGIDAARLPHIFDPFYEGHPIDRSPNSLGIGLALTKGLVEMHGGRILVTSAGIGHGSEFTIILPIDAPQ